MFQERDAAEPKEADCASVFFFSFLFIESNMFSFVCNMQESLVSKQVTQAQKNSGPSDVLISSPSDGDRNRNTSY